MLIQDMQRSYKCNLYWASQLLRCNPFRFEFTSGRQTAYLSDFHHVIFISTKEMYFLDIFYDFHFYLLFF